MPGEIMIIAVVAIVFGTISGVINSYLKYRSKQVEAEQRSVAGGNSLGTSELETLITAAVAQALGPVEDELRKLRRMNRRAEASALEPDRAKALGQGEPLVDLDDVAEMAEDDADVYQTSAPRRRSSS
jgi:hypothetical protein